jgi:hypothetical protein
MIRTDWKEGRLALVAVAALFVAGCGGGGDEEASAGSGQLAAREGGEGGNGSDAGASGEAAGEGATGGSAGDGSTGGDEAASGGAAGGEAASGGAAGGGRAGGVKGDRSGGAGNAGLQTGKAKKRPPRRRGSGGGSAGAGGGAATVPPSAESFFAAADAICGERRENTRQNLSDFTKVGLDNLENAAEEIVNELVIPNLEGEMREIEALNPPASASGAVSALFNAIEGMIAAGRAEPRNFILKADAVTSSEEVAKQNGFKVCGGI